MRGVVLMCVLALPAALAQPRAAPEVTDVLPYGTAVYLRLSNLNRVYAAMEVSGFKSALKKAIVGENPALAIEAEVWDKVLQQVQAAHVCLYDFAVFEHEAVHLDLLVILEGQLDPDPRQWVSPLLMPLLRPAGALGETQIYEVWHEEMREEAPIQILLAGLPGRFLISTDRMLLEGVLEAMAAGRTRPLSANPEFQLAVEGQTAHDVLAYVSVPHLLRSLDWSVEHGDRDELRAVESVLHLKDLVCGSWSQDFAGSVASVRVVMNPDGQLFRLLALPAAARKAPDFVPEDVLMLACANIGDGKATWQAVREYLFSTLVSLSEVNSQEGFDQQLAEAEKELGVRFEEIAAAVSGELGLAFAGPDPDRMVLFAFARDAAEAGRILQAIENAAGPGPRHATEDYRGVKLHIVGGENYETLVWALVDKCAFGGPRSEVIKACVDARQDGKPLSGSAPYRQVYDNLHAQTAGTFYLNLDALASVTGMELGELVPPLFAEGLRGVALGASIAAQDGMVDVRIASSRPLDPVAFFTQARAFVERGSGAW